MPETLEKNNEMFPADEEAIQKSKVIAAYMGYGLVMEHRPPQYSHGYISVMANGRIVWFEPHKDWKQLIEVIERVRKDAIVEIAFILGTICKIMSPTGKFKMIAVEDNDSIKAVYEAVYEYITKQKE